MSTDVPNKPVRVLVVDDEPLARLRVMDLLAHARGVEIIGEATHGLEAIAMIRKLAPDLVFLDVQMPGVTGLDVVKEIGHDAMPATIFVTAYDQYALQAFDVAAVDYLVKPYDDERFEEAFRRARRRLAREPKRYLERIAVEVRGKVRPVPVREIDFISAAGPYAELHTSERRHVIRESMQSLEDRLDPEQFMRVHRSLIVRLELVEALHRGAGGDYEVQLRGRGRMKVSRSRREALERWLGVRPSGGGA